MPKKNSLLEVFYSELNRFRYSREELDLDHLRQVDIYLSRIPANHSIYSTYSKGRVLEGLHILTAKYNIDEYDQSNQSYAAYYRDRSGAVKYINKLEGALVSALKFNLFISESDLVDHDKKLGLNPWAEEFIPGV